MISIATEPHFHRQCFVCFKKYANKSHKMNLFTAFASHAIWKILTIIHVIVFISNLRLKRNKQNKTKTKDNNQLINSIIINCQAAGFCAIKAIWLKNMRPIPLTAMHIFTLSRHFRFIIPFGSLRNRYSIYSTRITRMLVMIGASIVPKQKLILNHKHANNSDRFWKKHTHKLQPHLCRMKRWLLTKAFTHLFSSIWFHRYSVVIK